MPRATSGGGSRKAGPRGTAYPTIYVKPFVGRKKNDAANATAIAEAALRLNLHYVAVKSAQHQARAAAIRTHQSFAGLRTRLICTVARLLREMGLQA